MYSTDACERRKRCVNALSSRNKPSSRCSVSIYGEPNWLASYLAKKITRLAFSVYRSNIFPHPDAPSHLCRKHLSPFLAAIRDLPRKKPFCPASALRHEGLQMLRRPKPATCLIGRKT